MNKEDLLSLDPDMILDFVYGRVGRDLSSANQTSVLQELPELKALRQRRVYPVNEDYVPHASQRMMQAAELFARLIYNRRSQ